MSIVLVGFALAALITGPADTLGPGAVSVAETETARTQRPPGSILTVDAIVTVRSGLSVGTGFVIGSGRIVTAAHVVDPSADVNVQVGGRRLDARLVAVDASVDLALLDVASTDLPRLHLSDSLPPVGVEATAFSAADGTVAATRGIVSAYATVRGVPQLRTDAAVNAGSSGGPVVDASGQVVGVITTKMEGREGVAHAVTVDVLREFLETRPEAAAAIPNEEQTSTARPLEAGAALLLLSVLLLAFRQRRGRVHRSQTPGEIELGRSRIRLDADAVPHPQTGGIDVP